MFLPSYVNTDDFSLKKGDSVIIDNIKIRNSEIVDYLDGDEHVIKMNGREYPFVVLRGSDDVATMYITTESGSIKRIHNDKENKEKISLHIFDSNGKENYSSDTRRDTISGHGNTTWELYDKKPYTITFESPSSILSLDKSDKVVLLANAIDQTNLRNKFAYEMIRSSCTSVWAPDSRYVDVYINGEYKGLYLLCQKPTSYNARIDESEYYVDLLSQHVNEVLSSPNGIADTKFVEEKIDGINRSIMMDDKETVPEIIDKDSWVEKYLIDEVLLNNDAAVGSQYYHFSEESKIYAGPAWDYDNIFGAYHWVSNPNTFITIRRGSMDDSWYARLYENEGFFEEICNKYQYNIRPHMAELCDDLKTMYDEIYDSAYMNSKRWNVNLFDEDLVYLTDFIGERMEFLDRAWINKEKTYYVEIQTGRHYKSYTVFEPMTIGELFEREQIGGEIDDLIYRDTGQSVHIDDEITSEYIVMDDIKYQVTDNE